MSPCVALIVSPMKSIQKLKYGLSPCAKAGSIQARLRGWYSIRHVVTQYRHVRTWMKGPNYTQATYVRVTRHVRTWMKGSIKE